MVTSAPSTQIKGTSAGQGVKQVRVQVGVVGGAKAEALQFSLDGAAYVRVNSSNVSLTGLAPGPHRLKVKAENAVGTADPYPRLLEWHTRETSETEPLYVTPSPLSPSEFEVGGWSSGHYKWRLDGSPWTEAKESRTQSHAVSPNVMHFWEALPVTGEAVWSGPPLVYAWTVGAGGQHGRSLSVRDELTLTGLTDGNHTLMAKAVDAAGMLPLYLPVVYVVFTLSLGNIAPANATFSWKIDTIPPQVCNLTVLAPLPFTGAVNTANLTVDVTGVDESIVSSTYAVDGASSWSRARATESGLLVEVDVVGDGVHTMLVKARDAAGNESPRPCTNLTWRVDTTPPMLSVISPAPGFRTRHDWVTVALQGNEPLSAVLIWLPGAAAWLRSTALTVVLNTTGAGPKYALFRGGTTHVLASMCQSYIACPHSHFWQLIWLETHSWWPPTCPGWWTKRRRGSGPSCCPLIEQLHHL